MFPLTRKKCVSQGSRMLFFIPTVHSPELSSLTGLVIDQPKATVGAMQGRAEPTRDQGLVVPEGRQVRSYLASTSAASLSPPGQGVKEGTQSRSSPIPPGPLGTLQDSVS